MFITHYDYDSHVMGHDSSPGDYSSLLSRREMVSLAGASGVAALAGCLGSGAEEGTYRVSYDGNPADLHFNTSGIQNYRWPAGRAVFAPFMKYSFTDQKFLPAAVEEVEVNSEEEEVILNFRDDITWDNGDEWTTEDLDVQLQLAEMTGSSLWGYLEDYEIVDDTTARLDLAGPTNPQIIKFELTNFFVDTKKETHEEFLDKEDSEFLRWEWEDPVASGIYSFVSKDEQAFEFEPNPEFYNADNVDIDKFLVERYDGNTAQHQALMSGSEVDGALSLFVPADTVEQFPDHVVEVQIPAKWGYGIVFNHDDEHFGKREVRQAVAHVINRENLVENAGPESKFVTPSPCGIAPEDQEYWLDDWQDDFETYGAGESQTEEAEELLREAGYSRDSDDKWVDDSGDTIGGNYFSPGGWTDWTTMSNTVTDQLNDFGFDFSVETKPTNDWFAEYSNSNFAMGSLYWLPGGSRSAFPYFPLYYQLWEEEIDGGHNYREKAQSEQTIPGPDGGEMTITPLEEVEQIAQQPNDEESRPYVQRAAWHNHIELPFLGLVSKYEQSWTTDDDWTVAEEGTTNRQVKWPHYWWPHEGELQQKD